MDTCTGQENRFGEELITVVCRTRRPSCFHTGTYSVGLLRITAYHFRNYVPLKPAFVLFLIEIIYQIDSV